MIVIRGWIDIHFTDEEYFGTPSGKQLLSELEEYLTSIEGVGSLFNLKHINYDTCLSIFASYNRERGYIPIIQEVMERVGKMASESYGLVYIHQPEHLDLYDKFMVYKLAKGKVSIEEDSLLSPCSEKIGW